MLLFFSLGRRSSQISSPRRGCFEPSRRPKQVEDLQQQVFTMIFYPSQERDLGRLQTSHSLRTEAFEIRITITITITIRLRYTVSCVGRKRRRPVVQRRPTVPAQARTAGVMTDNRTARFNPKFGGRQGAHNSWKAQNEWYN